MTTATIKTKNYKKVSEILDMINTKFNIYPKTSEELMCLALTEFAYQIERDGATILSCSPKRIKTHDRNIVNTIGTYIKYTYDFHYQYYIQFDENPFFPPKGYKCYFNNKKRKSTGLIEYSIFNEINAYDSSHDNVLNLTTKIYEFERMLKEESIIFSNTYVGYRDNFNQEIYIF